MRFVQGRIAAGLLTARLFFDNPCLRFTQQEHHQRDVGHRLPEEVALQQRNILAIEIIQLGLGFNALGNDAQ